MYVQHLHVTVSPSLVQQNTRKAYVHEQSSGDINKSQTSSPMNTCPDTCIEWGVSQTKSSLH